MPLVEASLPQSGFLWGYLALYRESSASATQQHIINPLHGIRLTLPHAPATMAFTRSVIFISSDKGCVLRVDLRRSLINVAYSSSCMESQPVRTRPRKPASCLTLVD